MSAYKNKICKQGQESSNSIQNVQSTLGNQSSYQEPGKTQFEREKTTNASFEVNQMLELFDKEFKTAIIKMF